MVQEVLEPLFLEILGVHLEVMVVLRVLQEIPARLETQAMQVITEPLVTVVPEVERAIPAQLEILERPVITVRQVMVAEVAEPETPEPQVTLEPPVTTGPVEMVAELAAQEMLVILEVPVTLAAKVPVVREVLQLVA